MENSEIMTEAITDTSDSESRKLNAVLTEPESMVQGRSLVVVIGIDEYEHWPLLNNAVNDAIKLQQTLVDKLGFIAPIKPLINSAATKDAIEELITVQLREMVEENDSLVVFFAGHGQTRVDELSETGYIIPVEARTPDTKEYWSDYIRLNHWIQDVSELPIRHILVILDACHSGFALGSAINIFRDGVSRYRNDISRNRSRKLITSAKRDQPALDGGSILPGNSLFTGMLINGLDLGEADTDRNGLITSLELGLYLQQKVGQASESKQTPVFGAFNLDDGGEMVISLPSSNLGKGVDYQVLEDYLKSKKWKEADQLTFSIMLMIAKCEDKQYLDVEDIQRFPIEDLKYIDKLWTDYSKNRFGFSVQNKIWKTKEVDGNPHSGIKTFQKFSNFVGWRIETEDNSDAPGEVEGKTVWLDYNYLHFSLQAPEGHLPWGGYGDLGKFKRWRLGYLLFQFDSEESEKDWGLEE
jgi:hypothetical protein